MRCASTSGRASSPPAGAAARSRSWLPCEVIDRAIGGPVVNVEIWSDIACPWCAVGKRRFEAALANFEHRDDVIVTFRSFELDPDAPAEREGSTAEHLAAKYGTSLEQAHAMNDRMTQTAAEDGLEFRFDLARGGSTFDAHRLLHLAHTLVRLVGGEAAGDHELVPLVHDRHLVPAGLVGAPVAEVPAVPVAPA